MLRAERGAHIEQKFKTTIEVKVELARGNLNLKPMLIIIPSSSFHFYGICQLTGTYHAHSPGPQYFCTSIQYIIYEFCEVNRCCIVTCSLQISQCWESFRYYLKLDFYKTTQDNGTLTLAPRLTQTFPAQFQWSSRVTLWQWIIIKEHCVQISRQAENF